MANILEVKISETHVVRAYAKAVYVTKGNTRAQSHEELAFSVGPVNGQHAVLADGPAVQALLAMAAHKP